MTHPTSLLPGTRVKVHPEGWPGTVVGLSPRQQRVTVELDPGGPETSTVRHPDQVHPIRGAR